MVPAPRNSSGNIPAANSPGDNLRFAFVVFASGPPGVIKVNSCLRLPNYYRTDLEPLSAVYMDHSIRLQRKPKQKRSSSSAPSAVTLFLEKYVQAIDIGGFVPGSHRTDVIRESPCEDRTPFPSRKYSPTSANEWAPPNGCCLLRQAIWLMKNTELVYKPKRLDIPTAILRGTSMPSSPPTGRSRPPSRNDSMGHKRAIVRTNTDLVGQGPVSPSESHSSKIYGLKSVRSFSALTASLSFSHQTPTTPNVSSAPKSTSKQSSGNNNWPRLTASPSAIKLGLLSPSFESRPPSTSPARYCGDSAVGSDTLRISSTTVKHVMSDVHGAYIASDEKKPETSRKITNSPGLAESSKRVAETGKAFRNAEDFQFESLQSLVLCHGYIAVRQTFIERYTYRGGLEKRISISSTRFKRAPTVSFNDASKKSFCKNHNNCDNGSTPSSRSNCFEIEEDKCVDVCASQDFLINKDEESLDSPSISSEPANIIKQESMTEIEGVEQIQNSFNCNIPGLGRAVVCMTKLRVLILRPQTLRAVMILTSDKCSAQWNFFMTESISAFFSSRRGQTGFGIGPRNGADANSESGGANGLFLDQNSGVLLPPPSVCDNSWPGCALLELPSMTDVDSCLPGCLDSVGSMHDGLLAEHGPSPLTPASLSQMFSFELADPADPLWSATSHTSPPVSRAELMTLASQSTSSEYGFAIVSSNPNLVASQICPASPSLPWATPNDKGRFFRRLKCADYVELYKRARRTSTCTSSKGDSWPSTRQTDPSDISSLSDDVLSCLSVVGHPEGFVDFICAGSTCGAVFVWKVPDGKLVAVLPQPVLPASVLNGIQPFSLMRHPRTSEDAFEFHAWELRRCGFQVKTLLRTYMHLKISNKIYDDSTATNEVTPRRQVAMTTNSDPSDARLMSPQTASGHHHSAADADRGVVTPAPVDMKHQDLLWICYENCWIAVWNLSRLEKGLAEQHAKLPYSVLNEFPTDVNFPEDENTLKADIPVCYPSEEWAKGYPFFSPSNSAHDFFSSTGPQASLCALADFQSCLEDFFFGYEESPNAFPKATNPSDRLTSIWQLLSPKVSRSSVVQKSRNARMSLRSLKHWRDMDMIVALTDVMVESKDSNGPSRRETTVGSYLVFMKPDFPSVSVAGVQLVATSGDHTFESSNVPSGVSVTAWETCTIRVQLSQKDDYIIRKGRHTPGGLLLDTIILGFSNGTFLASLVCPLCSHTPSSSQCPKFPSQSSTSPLDFLNWITSCRDQKVSWFELVAFGLPSNNSAETGPAGWPISCDYCANTDEISIVMSGECTPLVVSRFSMLIKTAWDRHLSSALSTSGRVEPKMQPNEDYSSVEKPHSPNHSKTANRTHLNGPSRLNSKDTSDRSNTIIPENHIFSSTKGMTPTSFNLQSDQITFDNTPFTQEPNSPTGYIGFEDMGS